jgi:DNA-binding response OmpR family regulator
MGTRVFVVDDEQVIADSLAAILNMSGFEAKAFYEGESVLAACAINCPDCVISDVVMPGISGIEMAVEIGRRYPTCKVLLFSGQAATADMLDVARKAGHEFEVILKPVHPTELLARLAASRPCMPEIRSDVSLGMDR